MAIHPTHLVAATALNFRSEPQVRPGNRLAVLAGQTAVEKLTEHDEAWWRVAVELDGAAGEGFVAARFLAPLPVGDGGPLEPPTPAPGSVPAVHLGENRPHVTRDNVHGRAFPIGETGRPGRTSADAGERARELSAILDWLDVEHSRRYQPTSSATYCNIYAHDACYLAGAYLPRVWWRDNALLQLRVGVEVPVRYSETVTELNANSLFYWLADFGSAFGWRRTLDLDELQQAANHGAVGLLVARHHDLNRSGHIAVAERESDDLQAARSGGRVSRPITSQAGRRNHRRQVPSQPWWALSPHSQWAAWFHE